MLTALLAPAGAPLRILCLGAHCDDIEIGCGGTVLRLLEERPGSTVHWVALSSTPEREREARASAAEFLAGAAPGSPVLKTVLPRMTSRDFTPNFRLALMAKDLAYSLKEGERLGVDLSLVASALDAFNQAISAGKGDDDFSAVVEPLRSKGTK